MTENNLDSEKHKNTRRVFRDYLVLLVSNRLTLDMYKNLLVPMEFGQIECTHDDTKAVGLIKKIKPNLVVASLSLSIFTGAQILSAVRQQEEINDIPFLIIGVKEDLKPGGMAEQINKTPMARFLTMPTDEKNVSAAILELMDQVIDQDQEEAYRLIDQAEAQVKAGDLIEASETYTRALELYDQHQGAWLKLGSVLTEMEAFDEAEDSYLKALGLNKFSMMAYFGLADLYERRGDFEQTISVLRQALGIAKSMKYSEKSQSKINFFIGEFELRLKRLTGAEESFENAIELNPDDAELRTDIGDAYAEKGYWAESEKHYQSAIEIDPNQAHVFNRLGIAYRRQAKYEKALHLYDNARLYHPDDEHLLFNMARAHWEAEQSIDAEAMLEEALTMAPNFKVAKTMISRLRAAPVNELDKVKFPEEPEDP